MKKRKRRRKKRRKRKRYEEEGDEEEKEGEEVEGGEDDDGVESVKKVIMKNSHLITRLLFLPHKLSVMRMLIRRAWRLVYL